MGSIENWMTRLDNPVGIFHIQHSADPNRKFGMTKALLTKNI